MSNVTQAPTGAKVRRAAGPSVAWRWGYQAGREGKSVFLGYNYFAGENLADYQRGHKAGQYVTRRLASVGGA